MLYEAGVRKRGDFSFGRIPRRTMQVGGADDVVAEAGHAMDANMIVKRPPKGASESSGRSKNAEFVCWYYEKE